MSHPSPDRFFANLYAARIVHLVTVLPEVSSLGKQEAIERVEQRCLLLLGDPDWREAVDAELARIDADEARGAPHLRASRVFASLSALLRHDDDPHDDLVNLLFGR